MTFHFHLLAGLFILLSACQNRTANPENIQAHTESSTYRLSDPDATPRAEALYHNLLRLAPEHIMIAHQDALAYGMGWKGEEFRSDIGDVLGDHPAVFGWDLGHMGDPENIDGVPFEDMKKWAIAAYEKGGINTYSWHMRNYAIGGSSWDRDSCVAACLPGGEKHSFYRGKLDEAADFFSSLRNKDGELIPVIFRPFHEMTGGWFWWGRGNCSPEEYTGLFRFTIDYLRKEKKLHNLLVCYSTDKFRSPEEYMHFYPGDDYVDILAFDDYHGIRTAETSGWTVQMLETLDSLATAHKKLMTFSETGVETIPDPRWFTQVVLPILKHSPATKKISYILLWRNGRPDHFYAPYPEHPSAPDFIEFMNDELMLSLSELPHMYKPL